MNIAPFKPQTAIRTSSSPYKQEDRLINLLLYVIEGATLFEIRSFNS